MVSKHQSVVQFVEVTVSGSGSATSLIINCTPESSCPIIRSEPNGSNISQTQVTSNIVGNKLSISITHIAPAPHPSKRPFFSSTSSTKVHPDSKNAIYISLPSTTLSAFSLTSSGGTLVWEDSATITDFKAHIENGSIKINSRLETVNLDLQCVFGSIQLFDAIASEQASLAVTTRGNIKGNVHGFKSLTSRTGTGSTDLFLYPKAPPGSSKIRLEASSGNVVVKVFGFNGSFDSKTELGAVKVVSGNGIESSFIGSGMSVGVVGVEGGEGEFSAVVGLGSVLATFCS